MTGMTGVGGVGRVGRDRSQRQPFGPSTAVVAAIVGELVVIFGQAARGRASHFNVATPFDRTLSDSMATSVVVLWLASFVLAVIVARQRFTEPATTWAIRLGLGLSLGGMLIHPDDRHETGSAAGALRGG